jgi:hypothetical protein
MPYSLPHFYGGLFKVETVESGIGGKAMKDFVKATLVMGGLLALAMTVRVAAFAHLPNPAMAVKDPAPIAAADKGCGVMAVKMPCFRHANPEGWAMASVPRQSGSADAAGSATIAAHDTRCAVRQVKMPCLQPTDRRS